MAVALGIMVWGGAQWLGIARKALPFTAAPSPSDPPFPICKMKRADPKMAGVQKYNLRAHTHRLLCCPALRRSVNQHHLIWHPTHRA